MRIIKRKHNYILFIIFSVFIQNCQLQDANKVHGINFLENREKVLKINKTNKNDVIALFGKPHTKSINNENKWMYFERTTSKGKLHKLGQNVLVKNNILELTFDKYGILKNTKLYNKKNKNKIRYSDKKTINTKTKVGYAASMFQSIKQKMYRNK